MAECNNSGTHQSQKRQGHQLGLACFIFLSMSVAMLKMPCVGWSQAAHFPVFMLCLHSTTQKTTYTNTLPQRTWG